MKKKADKNQAAPGKLHRTEDGRSSQSPMAENVGDIDLHKGAGDDTDVQSNNHKEPVRPLNQRAADINGVQWEE